jgi:hypothetical protein
MTGARIAASLALVIALAIMGATIAPRAFDAGMLLAAADDPVALADHAVARMFSAAVAAREIAAALAADDPDLARSFLELARERKVAVDPLLMEKVAAASSGLATASRSIRNFARGLISGEPDDVSGLAGTVMSDLLVIGDLRDLAREGSRFAAGQPVDELILAMAWAGPLATAGTYGSAGVAVPVRVGLTVVKVARRTGRIGNEMAAWINQTVSEVVDWAMLRRAAGGPVVVVRAARQAVRVEKAQVLVRLAEDVGRVQARAGTQAALDGLKLAHGSRDVTRIATLAAAKGGKTRAILKLAGRGAIALTVSAVHLALWVLSAVLTALGLVASLKRTAERMTERACARRRARAAGRGRLLPAGFAIARPVRAAGS